MGQVNNNDVLSFTLTCDKNVGETELVMYTGPSFTTISVEGYSDGSVANVVTLVAIVRGEYYWVNINPQTGIYLECQLRV